MMVVIGTIRTVRMATPAAEGSYAGQEGACVPRSATCQRHAHLTNSAYWTCNRVIFQSTERIFVSVLEEIVSRDKKSLPPYHDM